MPQGFNSRKRVEEWMESCSTSDPEDSLGFRRSSLDPPPLDLLLRKKSMPAYTNKSDQILKVPYISDPHPKTSECKFGFSSNTPDGRGEEKLLDFHQSFDTIKQSIDFSFMELENVSAIKRKDATSQKIKSQSNRDRFLYSATQSSQQLQQPSLQEMTAAYRHIQHRLLARLNQRHRQGRAAKMTITQLLNSNSVNLREGRTSKLDSGAERSLQISSRAERSLQVNSGVERTFRAKNREKNLNDASLSPHSALNMHSNHYISANTPTHDTHTDSIEGLVCTTISSTVNNTQPNQQVNSKIKRSYATPFAQKNLKSTKSTKNAILSYQSASHLSITPSTAQCIRYYPAPSIVYPTMTILPNCSPPIHHTAPGKIHRKTLIPIQTSNGTHLDKASFPYEEARRSRNQKIGQQSLLSDDEIARDEEYRYRLGLAVHKEKKTDNSLPPYVPRTTKLIYPTTQNLVNVPTEYFDETLSSALEDQYDDDMTSVSTFRRRAKVDLVPDFSKLFPDWRSRKQSFQRPKKRTERCGC